MEVNTATSSRVREYLSCCACEMEKPVSEFNRKTDSTDGYQSRCRACSTQYSAGYTAGKDFELRNRTVQVERMKGGLGVAGVTAELVQRIGEENDAAVVTPLLEEALKQIRHLGQLYGVKIETTLWMDVPPPPAAPLPEAVGA